jgi:hypothetical protein
MIPAALELDFIRAPRRLSPLGAVMLVAGLAAAAWVVVDYRELATQDELVQMQLAAADQLPARARRTAAPVDARSLEEASAAVVELSLPWSQLLDQLEAAGQDNSRDIALLSVEPDPEKRRVRIGAEARNLPAALAFVQRLQAANMLEHPLLDNHKVRTDQSERPVYFEMTADWRLP